MGLLPSYVRERDARDGGPLRSLLAVIAEQMSVVEENLDQLDDDLFIETCAPWVIPYIGELLGYRPIDTIDGVGRSSRADVGHTIRFRRRKGTIGVLEGLATDLTGWPARAVESFRLLATTQHVNHVRPERTATPSTRGALALEHIEDAFSEAARFAEARPVDEGIARCGGERPNRFNLPVVSIHLWRLRPMARTGAEPFKVDPAANDPRWRLHPLGVDIPLVVKPRRDTDADGPPGPLELPTFITRRTLDAAREALVGSQSSIEIIVDGQSIPASRVRSCALVDHDGSWAHLDRLGDDEVFIDPVLGRFALGKKLRRKPVQVTFHTAASATIGGGEYERGHTFTVGDDTETVVLDDTAELQAALDSHASGGVIEVADQGRARPAQQVAISLDDAARLELRAANARWTCLALKGDLEIDGGAGAEVELSGLLISGGAIRVVAANEAGLRRLRLRDCTLVPGVEVGADGVAVGPERPSLVVEAPGVEVSLDRCVTGGLRVHADSAIEIVDSVIDAAAGTGERTRLAYGAPPGTGPGGALTVRGTTIVGRVHARAIGEISNTILLAEPVGPGLPPIRVEHRQTGCVRFSFVPPGSVVPRRHRCVPGGSAGADAIRPRFISMRYGHPGYMRLHDACACAIRAGADDGGELGAMHAVEARRREANLRVRLREHLRVGLEALVVHET